MYGRNRSENVITLLEHDDYDYADVMARIAWFPRRWVKLWYSAGGSKDAVEAYVYESYFRKRFVSPHQRRREKADITPDVARDALNWYYRYSMDTSILIESFPTGYSRKAKPYVFMLLLTGTPQEHLDSLRDLEITSVFRYIVNGVSPDVVRAAVENDMDVSMALALGGELG